MGAKYIPSIKDLRANDRFLQRQKPMPKFKKSAPAKGSKKK